MENSQLLLLSEPASQTPKGQASSPTRILLVDDDGDMRQLNTEALINSGYEVDGTKDGAAAWQALATECYDLMITDNKMPKVTGIDLLRKLRAAHMALPVIMATGKLPDEEFRRHPWLRPTATLLKPYTIDELLETVQEVLRATDGPYGRFAPPPNFER
jgi:DNA-binding response OmpR family regulator